MPVKVKICGVTSVADAELAADLGADLLGLNFYPPSPRALATETAAEIAEAMRRRRHRPRLVGVFVDRPTAEIHSIDAAVGLDLVQFHGSETAAEIAPFSSRALQVLRVRERFADEAKNLAGIDLWGVLVDTLHPRLAGGTGETWRFDSARGAASLAGRRWLIAGGLTPENIAAAIRSARPWGVDLCSGVESVPGSKDPELLRRLFEEIEHEQGTTAA